MTAMKKTRDDKTALLVDQKGNRSLFHDVVALNNTLGEDDRTVSLFRKLDRNQKELATQCWDVAKDAVIKAKAYDLARKYIGNPVREFGKVKAMYDMNVAMYGGKNFGESFKAYNKNHFIEETIRLIDVAVALNDTKAAGEIQERALAVLDDYRLRDAIPAEKTKDAQPTNAPYSSPAAGSER
ncbi:MAG: hypothetical protein WC381_07490 [Kiritimatiellia bacterium]|jgi:hypothetical protein